jgi:hypothetical protein
MLNNKISKISLGVLVTIGGISFGVIGSNAIANNQDIKTHSNVILEEASKPKSSSLSVSENTESTNKIDDEDLSLIKISYVNYNKEKITEIIKMYAVLENCRFQNSQKDEFIYYLSEYVTSAVQAEKYTTKELKEQYINFAQAFQPPHPTEEDCIETYNDAKESVIYWNEKKNTAFNELFSPAKNRYSPDPEENIDIVQELIEIPYANANSTIYSSNNNFYSLAEHAKKLPWNIKTSDIFNISSSKNSENNLQKSIENVEKETPPIIIPDKKSNINKLATIDDKPFEDSVKVHIEPTIIDKKLTKEKK